MKKLRERTIFPAADGWIVFENNSQRLLDVVMEPWALGGTIPVGENAHVLVKPDGNSPTTIIFQEDVIQIYCADAMYRNGIEILDMTDE